jgi:hypothetical protein
MSWSSKHLFRVLAGGAPGTVKNIRNRFGPDAALSSDSVSMVLPRTALVVSEEYVATNRSPGVFTGPHNSCVLTKSLQPNRLILAGCQDHGLG